MANEKYSFYKYLIDEGFYFDKKIIENYLLSLKVNPFIIFSGNSGIGKISLSKLFVKYLSDNHPISINAPINFSSWYHQEWRLNSNFFKDIFPIHKCNIDCKIFVDNIPAIGKITPWIHLTYENINIKNNIEKISKNDLINLEKNDPNHKKIKEIFKQGNFGSLEITFDTFSLKNCISNDYLFPNGSILLKQNSGKSVAKDREWTISKRFFDYIPFKSGENPCNITIFNINSNATIRFAFHLKFEKNKKLQDYLKQNLDKEVSVELKIDNFDFNSNNSYLFKKFYRIVVVEDNWVDSTNIMGYYDSITGKYQSTPTYELINEAKYNINQPYFLILDGVNRSHIERYFADFLLAINNNEPIKFFDKPQIEVNIPKNFFIIATLNTDEINYPFPSKILEMANVIELDNLSVVDYIDLDFENDDFQGDVSYIQSPLVDSDISNLKISDLKDILSNIGCKEGNLLKILTNELNSFQLILKNNGFGLGFDIINEILKFMVVSWRYENSPKIWENWQRYFDAQIKQKILTKLHGSMAMKKLLNDLFKLCLTEHYKYDQSITFDLTNYNCKYFTSAFKIQEMLNILNDQKFVSFINYI